MAQKLYTTPATRPIQDPSGTANGLSHYTSMRSWVEQTEAGKGEIFIYEDFAKGFNCAQRKASDETKTAGNSFNVADWKVIAIGAHTEAGGIAVQNVHNNGRITVTTNATDDDYVHLAYFNDICQPSRPWSYEIEVAIADQVEADFAVGVMSDTVLVSANATTAANGVYFQRVEAAAFSCVTRTGGSAHDLTVSSVTPVNNLYNTLGIDYDGVGTVKFYIDGAVVATHTGFTAAQPTRPAMEITACSAAIATAKVNHIAFYQSM